MKMKQFSAEQISKYCRDYEPESAYFQYEDHIIRSYGHYQEKLSIINIEEWVSVANDMIEKSNNNKGKWKVSGAEGHHWPNGRPIPAKSVLEDFRGEIVSVAMEKCQKRLKRV
jgi:hypothetical protein